MKERIVELLNTEYDALDIMAINDRLGLTSVEDLRNLLVVLDRNN